MSGSSQRMQHQRVARKRMTPDDQLITGTIRHNAQQANAKYYEWIKTCLTVSSGSLALLIGLQGNYVPQNPQAIWAIKSAWICLSGTVILTLVALAGDHGSYNAAARYATSPEFIESVQKRNMIKLAIGQMGPPWYCTISAKLFPWTFAASVILLTIFAVRNI